MDQSEVPPAALKVSDKPVKTYQRPSKAAAVQKPAQIDEPGSPEVVILECVQPSQNQDKCQDYSHNLSASTVPPEMLVINIEEVMSSTHFDPELLNAVKDRGINAPFKAKQKTPETLRSAGSNKVPSKPTVSVDPLNVIPAEPANPTVSEAILAKPMKPEACLKKPNMPEGILSKLNVSDGTLEKPKVLKKILVKPVVSESVPLTEELQAESVGSEVIFVKSNMPEVILVNSNVPEVVPASPTLSKVVLAKSNVSEVEPKKPEVQEGVSSKLNVSDETSGKPTVMKKIVLQPMTFGKTKPSTVIVTKSKGHDGGTGKPKVSKGIVLKPSVPAGVALKPVVPAKAKLKPIMSAGISARLLSPKKVSAKPVLPKEVPAKPTSPKGVLTKLTTSKKILVKTPVKLKSNEPKVVITTEAKPKVLSPPVVKHKIVVTPIVKKNVVPTPLVKPIKVATLEEKPKIVKTVITNQNVLKPAVLNRKVIEVAGAMSKATVEVKGTPEASAVMVFKPQTHKGRLLSMNKRCKSILVTQPSSESAEVTPTITPVVLKTETFPEDEVPELEPIPIEPKSSLIDPPEYVMDYDPADNVEAPRPAILRSQHPIPLPIVENEPVRPEDAISLLKHRLSLQLPRHWSLRIEDDAIYAMLFASGPRCVVQRAIYVPYDGSNLKFIVHGREIPANHSVYQYRLMKPPVELTVDTALDFADVVMGALHAIIQLHVCVGLEEEQFVEEWQEYTNDCRFDENLFEEEDYERTVRPMDCTFLVARRSTKRCPECTGYYLRVKGREKRRAVPEIQVIAQKKAKNV